MENKAHALAAGAFVLAVSALLLALAWWLTRDGAVRTVYELSSAEAVSGLNVQAAVRYKGVPVGKVTGISFDPIMPGNVLVRIAVDSNAPVSQSTFAVLGYQGVTGIAHIQLDDAGGSKAPLTGVDGEPPRIPLRPSFMGRLTDQGGKVLVQVEEATRRLNQLLAPEHQKALVGAVTRAGDAAQGVQQLTADLRAVLAGQAGPGRANVPQLLQDARGTLVSLQATSGEARQAVAEVQTVLRRAGEPGGLLERLAESAAALSAATVTLNADTLPQVQRTADGADRALRQVGQVAGQLGDNPQSLLFGTGRIPPGPGEAGFVVPAAARP
jgi:phospholipid/cholesterol/gamma-HCH transport system substrate-binding protein